MIHITNLPFPPSMNHRHIVFGGMMRKNPDHREFEARLRLFLLKDWYPEDGKELIGKKLSVDVIYEGPKTQWYTKKGEIKKTDVDNRHKNLLDVVFPFFDLDDSQIFEINIKKIARDCLVETSVTVCIEELK